MGNQIVEKYFDYSSAGINPDQIAENLAENLGFKIKEELFRGKIYNNDKTGTLILKGDLKGKKAVLKLQFLKPEEEEPVIIDKFNKQNGSKIIRLPSVFSYALWDNEKKYGYTLMELVKGNKLYPGRLLDIEEIKEFCIFYEDYKKNCCRESLFDAEIYEKSSLVFCNQRIAHWSKISISKNIFQEEDLSRVEEWFILSSKNLPSIKMEFMHGHLTLQDITKITIKEYVLMSTMFWSYRPEYYDITFQLWASIKDIRDLSFTLEQIIEHLDLWLIELKKIPFIKEDNDFERKFNMMMLERCVGALLLDIVNQDYKENKEEYIEHLRGIFRGLFDYLAEKLG